MRVSSRSYVLASFLLLALPLMVRAADEQPAWPQENRPFGNFNPRQYGVKLVDDPAQIKMAWVSEDKDLGFGKGSSSGFVSHLADPTTHPGTASGLIVADGKVFAGSFRPRGEAWAEKQPGLKFSITAVRADLVADASAKNVPSSEPRRADVCVYAATPAGILAAVAVAREGRSVVIVEPSRWVGGILGAGIKPAQDCANRPAVGGLTVQVFAKAGGAPAPVRTYFQKLLAEHKIPVIYEHRLKAADKEGRKITRLRLERAPPDKWGCPVAEADPGPGLTVEAQVFIDASYEGDMMPKAGVSYAIGREPVSSYGESLAGVRKLANFTPIDPYQKPGDPSSGLLPLVEADHGKALGEGDDYTQAYNFRFYVTADPQKRAPFTVPENYDPKQFELVGRYVAYLVEHRKGQGIDGIFPGWRNSGEYNYQRESLISISPLGVSRLYQDGDYATRAKVWKMHIDYLRGLHHFLSTDPRVPEATRKKVAELGLDKTHHPDTEGWPHQLYVRVARRLVGSYVLTQADVGNKAPAVSDPVGLAYYAVDVYPPRRIAVPVEKSPEKKDKHAGAATEGKLWEGAPGSKHPYAIPFRAIVPKNEECANLLVPVCFSASYIAYSSARMEPVFMIVGESAGVAAAQAVAQKVDVQQIDARNYQARLRELGQIVSWPVPEH